MHHLNHLLCADWARQDGNRICCQVDLNNRRIVFGESKQWTFTNLLEHARELSKSGKVLLSLDLAIGVPKEFLALGGQQNQLISFLDWLMSHKNSTDFWKEIKVAKKWSTKTPFVSVPPGEGSLNAFHDVAGHDLRRSFDRKFGGKSPFIVNGIPGTVGSGTRSFWRELLEHLGPNREFAIWPFDGALDFLLSSHSVVVGENYPAISYTAVFADELPSPRLRLSKTKQEVREAAIKRIGKLDWIDKFNIHLPDLGICAVSEDHFDALMVALGQLRCLLQSQPLINCSITDEVAEGGIIGSGVIKIDCPSKLLDKDLGVRRASGSRGANGKTSNSNVRVSCPILGCTHVYKTGRSGWDSHVASTKNHIHWHPQLTKKRERKDQFKRDFPEFFA